MATILSLLALLVIGVLGFKYAYLGKAYLVSSALSKRVKFRVNSRQRLMLLLLASGIVQAGGFSAILLLLWIAFLILLVLKYGVSFSGSPLFRLYAIYLVWLLISLFFSPEKQFGLRVFLKYLFPFLVVLVVSKIKIDEVFFLKALKVTFTSFLIANLTLFLPKFLPIGSIIEPLFGPVVWWGPAIIDANPFAIAVAFILFKITNNKKFLLIIPIIVLIPMLASIRTGLVGIGIFLLAASFFKYKIKALPIYLLIILGFVFSILFVPAVRDKMFRESFSSAQDVINSLDYLTIDSIDSSGRFAMWEWSLEEYYNGHEYMGSGLGQLQERFYSGNHPFSIIKAVHNDYIQIICDTGLIGLVLYLLIIVSFVGHSFQIYNNKKNSMSARNAAFIAGTSICGIMACAFTDNVINYSLITLSYPFVFFGFALVFKKRNILKYN